MVKLKTLSIYFDPLNKRALFESPSYLVDFFSYVLCPIDSHRVKSVSLFLGDQKEVIDLEDSIQVREVFEFDHYLSLSGNEGEMYVLQVVCDVMCELGDRFGWDTIRVRQAVDIVSQAGFFFAGKWSRLKTSPNKAMKADIWVEYKRKIELFVRVFESKSLVWKELISSGEAGFPSLTESFSDFTWEGNSLLRIYAGNRRDYWNYPIGGKPEFVYCREDSDDGHGDFVLGKMYLDGRVVLQDEAKGLVLIRKSAENGYNHARRFLQRGI